MAGGAIQYTGVLNDQPENGDASRGERGGAKKRAWSHFFGILLGNISKYKEANDMEIEFIL